MHEMWRSLRGNLNVIHALHEMKVYTYSIKQIVSLVKEYTN